MTTNQKLKLSKPEFTLMMATIFQMLQIVGQDDAYLGIVIETAWSEMLERQGK